MKKNKIFNIKGLVVVLSLLLLLTSCDGWIDHSLNVDPDSPSDVPMKLLLPAIQQSMGYNLVGNNTVRTNNIWMQQFDGVSRQSFTEARYQLQPADVNNVWVSIYSEMLINSTIIINKAQTVGAESPNFEGVAEVLMATTLGMTSDLFGDIPYSEAFKGSSESLFTPVYDSQESIYNNMFSLLDDAVDNLNNTTNAIPIEGDVIYGGNVSNWIKAANAIKARSALQLSLRNGNNAYSDALAALANGFTSNADDLAVPFEDENRNPIFQFMEQRTDIRMCATLVDMMSSNSDPRLPFYAAEDGDGNLTGSIAGSENAAASFPGEYIASETSPTYLMTYSEQKFIEAESLFMLGQSGAQEAYEEAVAASVLRVTGEANTTWLDANINGVTVTLENIMTQKYIDGFGTNQPYADYRRTGFPNLTPVPNGVQSTIPTRFPYAQSELDNNSGNVPSVILTDKVWWDN